ncbi:hypothetical protein DIPPA_32504 [Diplonema papillatum]|nr:hypothetical protein DIPPA_24034 [Diplonema papillatum]KAJ9440469.1 hypothetical protein DIPPA_22681 [Diplonema papillatum]KAJ9449854.1 hypothetical protein DIPPA_09066 [Diplonema papillatum]KAJ9464829.1 hypothetical protein DIPPA_32504 [Diplonema papillatum]
MPQVDEELREAIDSSALSPVLEAQRRRRAFLDRWRSRAGELVYNEGDACHVALLGEMLAELRIAEPDSLLANLKEGCPMAGPVGYASLYSPSLGDPELSVEELIRRQPDVLARVRRAVRGESVANKGAIWASVQKEVDRGFMVELVEPPTNAVFLRRFMVSQLKADQKGWQTKLRACDDGRMALVNKAVHMTTRVRLDTVDVFVEVARQLAQQASGKYAGTAFYSVGLDHRDAYRQMKAQNDVICRCVVAEGPDGLLRFFRLDRLSFGEAASVVHYNAFAKILARVVRSGLSLPLLQYYDDFACPCRLEDDLVLADILELLGGILRTSFNDEKTTQGSSFRHLGLIFLIDGDGVHVSLSEPRKEKLVFVLKGVLARDSLAPGEAASLAGKLGFASSSLFGKVGRVPLQPLFRRANASSTYRDFKLGRELRVSLQWWVDVLRSEVRVFQKSIPLHPVSPDTGTRCVLFTDACPRGLGAVLVVLMEGVVSSVEYYSCPVPARAVGLPIHALEFAAVSVAFGLWFKEMAGVQVSVWVDNNVVLASLVQGQSRARMLLAPVHRLWQDIARAKARVWFERVSSEMNIADLPSRLAHSWASVPFLGRWPVRRVPGPLTIDEAVADLLVPGTLQCTSVP